MSKKIKSEKKALVPRLRFPEYLDAGEWHKTQLGELGEFLGGGTPSKKNNSFWEGSIPWVSSSDISEESIHDIEITRFITEEAVERSATRLVPEDSILLVSRVGIGKLALTRSAICTSQDFTNLTPHTGNLEFLGYFLKANKHALENLSQGMAIKGFTKEDVSKFIIHLPKLEEQQKIADCLSSLDALIAAQADKIDALKAHKKGLMQQLFPREGETVPRLRFPEFRKAGEWDIVPLKKLANRRTDRNRDGKLTRVLTNSAEHGVVDQRDYFDKDIATQGNLENYFIVEKDDFVYNPRVSASAPVGPISINRVETGVMSPLYTVFQFKDSNTDFYAHYFRSSSWHQYMRQVGSTGARHDRMAISKEDFIAMPLPVLSPEEKQKIADCLSSLDALIAAQADKIDALKAHKKGLMQQLFPSPEAVRA